jgi:two-component system chemotaxis response regulator CheY
MRILIVDDDPTCRKIVDLRVKAYEGVEVVESADGDDAWTQLKRNHFDGVIVDWQMPGKNGLDIVRGIRKAGLRVPLMMVTGESEREKVVEAIQAGVNDYLIKPFDRDSLTAKLGKFLERVKAVMAATEAAATV